MHLSQPTHNVADNPERCTPILKVSRADSGMADRLEGSQVLSSNLTEDQPPEQTKSLSRRRRPISCHSIAHPPTTRKKSSASVASQPKHTSKSRSSSHASRPRLGSDYKARRLHSSPAGTLPRVNFEDAIAFHQRSYQLMQTLSQRHDRKISDAQQQLNVRLWQTGNSSHLDLGAGERDHEAATSHHPQFEEAASVQWTSDATRRQQYAEIDRRNRGIRKLLRKLVPACMSMQDTIEFYDKERGSDVGSVRRYRMKLDNENN